MPTQNLVVRMPPDLRQLAEARAEAERRSLSEIVKSAVALYVNGSDGNQALSHAVRRAEALQAKLDYARREIAGMKEDVAAGKLAAARAQSLETKLDHATAELARVRREGGKRRAVRAAAADPAWQENAFTAALEAATPDSPVSTAALIAVSGWSRDWVADLLTVMAGEGYVTRVRKGAYAPVPGADLREGIGVARSRSRRGAARTAPSRREAADGPASPPVPAVAPAEATDAQQAVVTELRDRIEAVAPGTVPFRAGPDVDCSHEDMRIRKGVCPDCKQWVTK